MSDNINPVPVEAQPSPILYLSGYSRTELLKFADQAESPIFITSGGLTQEYAKLGRDAIVVSDEDQFREVVAALSNPQQRAVWEESYGPIGTVVIESFDEIQNALLYSHIWAEGRQVPSFDDWSWLLVRSRQFLTALRKIGLPILMTGTSALSEDGSLSPGVIGRFAERIDTYVQFHFGVGIIQPEASDVSKSVLYTKPSISKPWVYDSTELVPNGVLLEDISPLYIFNKYSEMLFALGETAKPFELAPFEKIETVNVAPETVGAQESSVQVTGMTSSQDKINAILAQSVAK